MKSDLEQFEHGDEGTHAICRARLEMFGGSGKCCSCYPHEGCTAVESNDHDGKIN